MKALLILLFVATGCFPEWRGPSARLASQAENLMDNTEHAMFVFLCQQPGQTMDPELANQRAQALLSRMMPGANFQQYFQSLFTKKQWSEYLESSREASIRLTKNPDKETILWAERRLADFFSRTVFPDCRKLYERVLREWGIT